MIKRKLGQNFLINKNVAKREVDYADIHKEDVVLEIGPGKGIITKLLAERAKQVIAIEFDEQLYIKLSEILLENVILIHGDALKVDFKKLPKFNKIVSNLPYHISSPITFKFLEYNFSLAVLIYQKEFADRMIAKQGSKNYSRLSVGIYYKTHCEIVESVPKTCFKPKPKVDSSIIKLIPRKKHPFYVENEKFFFNLTKILFNHRRKMIKNTIDEFYDIQNNDIPYKNRRVEELTPEEIGELSNILFNIL